MAKILFETPLDLELFSQLETDRILHCGKSKRLELIRDGRLTAVNVAGQKLVTGASIRSYLNDCVSDPQPLGRSLNAKRTNARKAVTR